MGPPRDPPTESTLAQISLARRERETLERERRWFVRKRPRRDINLGSETQVTVTSKRHAQAERAKRYAVTVFSQSAQVHVQYGDAPPREAESEGGSAPEPRLMETPQLLPIRT